MNESLVGKHLNHEVSFDEVRWATSRKTSYDSRLSFVRYPAKRLLSDETRLYRLVPLANTRSFEGPWWMPDSVFTELRNDANRSSTGGGRLLRNYVAQYLALPFGGNQLSAVEIALTEPVYAWVGPAAALFARPGGMEQVFLPHLAQRGAPSRSAHARIVRTYSLCF